MRTLRTHQPAGVLLAGLSVACSLAICVQAGSPVAAGKKNGPARSRPSQQWFLGAPATLQNLTLFPVIAQRPTSTASFITLEEGLRSGTVTITEIGAGGRARVIFPGQQASDDAEVNKLLLTNRSGKTLVLIAGEMVVGGKQDRIVGHDCLIGSTDKPVPLDVFCIEQGRWSEQQGFGASNSIAEQRSTRRGRAGSGRSSGVAELRAGGVAFVPASGLVAPLKLREKAQADKDQSVVWEEVKNKHAENNTSSATTNLNAVFDDKKVRANVESYQQALEDKLLGDGVVGAVVAVGGKVMAADVFANESLFRAYWPKLLRSYALEAISTRQTSPQEPGKAQAESFLARVSGRRAVDGRRRVYRLVEHQSDSGASFELLTTSGKQSQLVHFNRVVRE